MNGYGMFDRDAYERKLVRARKHRGRKRALCLSIIASVLINMVLLFYMHGLFNHRWILGFDRFWHETLLEADTHCGFHGDGEYILIVDCQLFPQKALKTVEKWQPLPLTENLEHVMYNWDKPVTDWPEKIEHGYYKFYDSNSQDHSDDSGLFERYSYNFKLAVYDTDKDKLYYWECDT